MPRVGLSSGAYQARSLIASAQRSLNLFGEPMAQQQGEPAQMAHYPTPGLTVLGTLPQTNVRGLFQATTGGIYAVAGSGVYLVDPNLWTGTLLGSISTLRPYPVGMKDNGTTLMIVDGTAGGWTVNLASHAFAAVTSTAYYGADTVDYLDGYFLFNKPNTPQFYSSDNLATTFDPLYFANKESGSDMLVTLKVAKREIWLLGNKYTEVWFNAGAADFPFQQIPSVFIAHGCAAKYSVAEYDNAIYWLATNEAGQGIVLSGAGYATRRISTFAIENALSKYGTISDAIGMVYSLGGHIFYVLTFPTQDTTWVYDIATQLWHEWLYIDTNGVEHRHLANCMYNINGTVVAGDWNSGNLYRVDPTVFTDNGQPIKRVRAFPHLINDSKRVYYREFIADVETGNPGPVSSVQINTVVSSSFVAVDGTSLGSYSNANDIGASFTLISGGGAQIISDQVTGNTGGSTALYEASGVPAVADYTVQFRAMPSSYTTMPPPSSLFVIGRSTGAANTGYQAMIDNGAVQFHATLSVLGTAISQQLPLGTLTSGWYVAILTMLGSTISMTVYRSEDGTFLTPQGLWTAINQAAITISDTTYTTAGRVMLGGSWNG